MPAVARTYVTAGVALVGAGVISAAPITTPQPLHRTASFEVGLVAATASCEPGDSSAVCSSPSGLPSATPFTPTADSTNVFNIPANLFIALANTPYNFFTALGPGNVQLGSEPDGGPSFQPTYEGVTLNQPDGNVVGLGANLHYGGSWWVYSPTNILGTDAADVPRYQAITNLLVPFPALSVPLGNMVAAIAASQLPMDEGCTGTGSGACENPSGITSKMFDVRAIAALFSPEGYTYPEAREGITCSEDGQCYVKDPDGREVPWSGQTVKLDPTTPFTSFYNSLTGTPDVSSIKFVTPELVLASLASISRGLNTAYNPFVPGTQCAICAPFVPNPDNEPVPGPVFEDPDTTPAPEALVAGPATDSAVDALAASTPATDSAVVAQEAPAAAVAQDEDLDAPEQATGPKHRKPTATGVAVKNVRDSINSTISKLTDGFKKPSSKSSETDGKKAEESTSSKQRESGSGSGSSDSGSSDSGSGGSQD
ncbi:hypothetical protein KXD97_23545 [Mycobacterium sp. SMC-8]|uniref:hypothetical protein n=1 Tax=Mycobacterium sp. SMC-8 TaxID=2857060 RepID=UPI0021B1F11F|nr:hypothetical protein [Mycobacterium sp. SMC-8]UXA11013.1 hypothetical protein KXD97_23545 [Mycobacterium sp. SMC-8]